LRGGGFGVDAALMALLLTVWKKKLELAEQEEAKE
jgi:hypothetical protein